MTEFNQRSSAVAREVIESGQPVQVTNRGRVVMRLVPEVDTSTDPLAALVAEGFVEPPKSAEPWVPTGKPIYLSRSIEEVLEEVRSDNEI